MNTLWAASVRHLLRHPAQLALALLGLALGVGTIIAVDIATASSGRAFELSMEAVNGAATHEIRGGPGGVDEALYVRLKTSGIPVALTPIVEGYVDVGDETLQLIGIDLLVDASVRGDSRLSAAGPADTERGRRAAGRDGIDSITLWLTEPGASVMA